MNNNKADTSKSALQESARISIAVIIVCRNAKTALRKTLDSLRRISDPRIRIIIIDGASGDGTPEYIESQDNIHYKISEPDLGIYDAMNKGWRAAPADSYILYLGAGDQILSLPSNDEAVGSDGKPFPVIIGRCDLGAYVFHSRWNQEMRIRNTAHHQALLVRKELSESPPFDPGLRVYGDWDFNLCLLRRGVRGHYLPTLHAVAAPGGASWHHNLAEIRQIATKHSGSLMGWAAWGMNWILLQRRKSLPLS